jgi:hypothetical protein
MSANVFVHRGGPNKTTFFGDSLPPELPERCNKLYGASHNTRQSYSDRFTFHKSEEKLFNYIMAQEFEAESNIYTHALPAGMWLEYVTLRGLCPTVGLTFSVELVGLLDPSEVSGTDPEDFIDEQDITVLIAAADMDYDVDVCAEQYIAQWRATDPGEFLTSNKMIRIVITTMPVEDLFGTCANYSLGFELSASYTDPCFIDVAAGMCHEQDCGDVTTAAE